MKLAIVGQGAIGSLFAYYWQSLKPKILLRCLLKPSKELVLLDGQASNIHTLKEHIYQPRDTAFDILIVPIKCYQVKALINSIADWLLPSTVLLLVQNGMGGAHLLAQAFPNNAIYVGTSTDAVFTANEHTYQVTAYGKLAFGLFHAPNHNINALAELMQTFSQYHPNANICKNVDEILFRKLAINAAINPLTAILDIKNGQLLEHQAELEQVYQELHAIYQSLQLPFSFDDIKQSTEQVIHSTADNYSSMHQDVSFGRPTEVEGVLGFLIEQAQSADIQITYLQNLYTHIKKLET